MLQNAEFHRTIEELTGWLEATTAQIRSSEPVDLSRPRAVLAAQRDKFRGLHADLERCEPRVVSLQEAADQLELQVENRQCREVKRKLSMLSQKLRILINVCQVRLQRDSDKRLRNKSRSGHEERVLATQKCLVGGGNGRAFDARYLLNF